VAVTITGVDYRLFSRAIHAGRGDESLPRGYHGDPARSCRCTPRQIRQYQARLSGPLLDRIDIHILVPSVGYRELTGPYNGESSEVIGRRVLRARKKQQERIAGSEALCNARLPDRQISEFCPLDNDSHRLIEMAMERLGLSARAFTRIVKVARTIADLEDREAISACHVAEAIFIPQSGFLSDISDKRAINTVLTKESKILLCQFVFWMKP
jgi:predicted ATPase with chaperone activity